MLTSKQTHLVDWQVDSLWQVSWPINRGHIWAALTRYDQQTLAGPVHQRYWGELQRVASILRRTCEMSACWASAVCRTTSYIGQVTQASLPYVQQGPPVYPSGTPPITSAAVGSLIRTDQAHYSHCGLYTLLIRAVELSDLLESLASMDSTTLHIVSID